MHLLLCTTHPHCWKTQLRLFEVKEKKVKRGGESLGVKPWAPSLTWQCSDHWATTTGQPPTNHRPSLSSPKYCTGARGKELHQLHTWQLLTILLTVQTYSIPGVRLRQFSTTCAAYGEHCKGMRTTTNSRTALICKRFLARGPGFDSQQTLLAPFPLFLLTLQSPLPRKQQKTCLYSSWGCLGVSGKGTERMGMYMCMCVHVCPFQYIIM